MSGDRAELLAWTMGALVAAAAAMSTGGRALGDAPVSEPVSLRPRLETAGPQITLGDLFDVDAPAADIVVARAPEPGRTLSLEPEWVMRAAARGGLAWSNPNRLRRVSVAAASVSVSAEEIETLIADRIAERDGGDWIVDLSDARPRHAPLDAALDPAVISLERARRGDAVIALVSLGPDLAAEEIEARAQPAVETPVLRRPLALDEEITASDLEWVRMSARRVPANALLDADDLVGMVARRALRAGAPLRAYDVARPSAVTRGEIVMVVYESGQLRLTTRARALADAPAGESARFVNLQSNRTIEAVVVGPGLARAGLGRAAIGGAP